MRRRERPQGYLKEPSATSPSRRRKRPDRRLMWRDIVVNSNLYGRSRWLHSLDKHKGHPGGHESGSED